MSMTATAERSTAVRNEATTLVALAAGMALLLARSAVIDRGGSYSWLVLLYALLGAVALVCPSRAGRARLLHPAVVLALGLSAIGVVAGSNGEWPPVGPAPAAAAGLLVLAAVSEEAFFRRLLYERVLRWSGVTAAVAVSSLVFALVHVPLYGIQVVPVDLAAGVLFSWQRWASGGWAVPAVTHSAANLMAVLA